MAKNETTEGAATAAAQTHPHPASPGAAQPPSTENVTSAVRHEPAPVKREPPKPLGERYFQMKESRQTEWFATVNADVTPDECLDRNFWSQIFPKVSHGSRIVVFPENRAWYGELVVFGTGIGWVETKWIIKPVFAPASVLNYSAASDYEVREMGEIKKWSIIHRGDGRVVHSGEGTQEAASRWLAEFLRTQMVRAA